MKISNILKTLTFFCLGLILFSCEKSPVVQDDIISQPEGYKELYDLYKSGGTYNSVFTEDASLILISNRGGTLVMSLKNVVVEETAGANPKVVAVDAEGKWMVGGVSTAIPRNEALRDEDAIPFYLYFSNDRSLHLRISNGNHLIIKKLSIKIPIIKLTTSDGGDIVSKEDYKTGTITINDSDHLY